MAHVITDNMALPKKAASILAANVPVKPDTVVNQVVLAASVNDLPLGFVQATTASVGNPVSVQTRGVVKAICAASVGAGAEVGVASTNGALGPVSAASGLTKYAVGIAENAAAAGVTFSVLLRPRQIDAQV
jgi:hypothetical protein